MVGLALIAVGLRMTDRPASANPLLTARTPLSQAQFVRAGNAVCARYYRQIMPILESHPKTVRALTRYVRNSIPPMEREAAGLRALIPPRRDAATFQRLLRVTGQELRETHAVLHAFETGQVRRGVLLARHAGHLDKPYNALARKIGLSVCGLTGRQVRARYGHA